MSVYFFYGDEDYLIDKELKKYRSKLDKNFEQMNYVVYDKLSCTDLISILRTLPMMFGKLMIVINTHELIKEGNKSQSLFNAGLEDNQLNEIESALSLQEENNKNSVDIFFVEKYSKNDKVKKPDSRRKIYKIISKYTVKNFESIAAYKRAELNSIIQKLAKEKQIKVDSDAVDALISNKGGDIRAFDIELDKLAVYAYPKDTITKSMVLEVCSSNEDLFNLTDYLLVQDKGNALLELRKLLETRHPLEILSSLQTFVKRWIFMKLNSKKMSYKEIGDKLGRVHEYVVKLTLEKTKNISIKTFVLLRENLTEAEYKIKTGQVYSPQEELENAIIR